MRIDVTVGALGRSRCRSMEGIVRGGRYGGKLVRERAARRLTPARHPPRRAKAYPRDSTELVEVRPGYSVGAAQLRRRSSIAPLSRVSADRETGSGTGRYST